MCGLVGVAGYISVKHERVFKNMLEVDVIRGPHSTGVSVVTTHDDTWAKAAMLPQDFFDTRHFKGAMEGVKQLIMGHNRYATVGKVNTACAHPFDFDNIMGMHNGTLRNWRAVLANSGAYDVDSECLLAHMNEHGMDVFSKLDGAYALCWYDRNDRTFNLLRNNQRPLSTRMTKDKRTMFYASEAWMIAACAARNDVELDDAVHSIHPGKHLKWELPRNGNDGLGKPSARTVQMYVPPETHYPDYYGGSGRRPIPNPPVGHRRPNNLEYLPGVNEELRSYVGKQVTFYACEYKCNNPQTNQGFVEGMLADDPNHTVRISCTKEEGEDLLECMSECVGDVTNFVSEMWSGGKSIPGYLTVPYRTVELVDEEEEVSYGPKGEPLSEAEFDKLTSKGCSFCSANILYGEQVAWWNNEPFCMDCEEEHFPDQSKVPNLKVVN